MAGKIFYRERGKVGKGEKKPRFRLVAVAGLDMEVYGKHLNKDEIEQIAKAVGAKLFLLKSGEGKHRRNETVWKKEISPGPSKENMSGPSFTESESGNRFQSGIREDLILATDRNR